jgi:hypothetical protein
MGAGGTALLFGGPRKQFKKKIGKLLYRLSEDVLLCCILNEQQSQQTLQGGDYIITHDIWRCHDDVIGIYVGSHKRHDNATTLSIKRIIHAKKKFRTVLKKYYIDDNGKSFKLVFIGEPKLYACDYYD